MNIFKFEFKRNIKSLIYWSIGTSAIIVLFMVLFPSMKDMGMQELVGAKLDSLPAAVLETFNFSSATDFSNINDYLGYCLQYIAMAFGIYGGILGVNSIIEEESEGTIEFLYSKPVSRSKILWSKILSRIVYLLIFAMIIGGITIGISIAVKPSEIDIMDLMMNIKSMFIGMSFLGYIFMAIGIAISTILKRGKMGTSIGLSLFFITYILGIISKLKEEFSFIKYISPYEWVIPSKIIKDGFEVKFILIGFLLMALSLVAATFIYNKKDMNIN
ncbi:ABC transporter permease subunit [Clostridium sp.]|uniref:ABC transporter permease subunit n=1 Tax=Clostridium sp. TaxID=1506 RepID=UPI00290A9C11|nr:ABC transporter permease subunit [Clostridium sp.]MDU5105405.1 ABC transporter permease subunit [Clostridium sp.]